MFDFKCIQSSRTRRGDVLGSNLNAVDTESKVVKLTPENFDKVVMDPSKDVFVKFFAPWCGHCKHLAPTWEALAKANPKAVIAEVDADEHAALGARFKIAGFPTLKMFSKADKSGNEDYHGGRDLEAFKSYIADLGKPVEPSKVVKLTPENFDQVVMDPSKHVFVKFFAPWCGHCKHLAPTWEALAKANPQAVIAEVNADEHNALGSKYGIQGFPTLKMFSKDDKSGANTYRGARSLEAFKSYIADLGKPVVPSKVVKLTAENFDRVVMDPSKDVFVKFFAPWCGHCQHLAPTWEELAKHELAKPDGVVIAELDATEHRALGEKFEIQGFPTLKMFGKTDKTGKQEYEGPRQLEAFQAYLDTHTTWRFQ